MKTTNANPLTHERTVPDDYTLSDFLHEEAEKLTNGDDSVIASVEEFERSGIECAYRFIEREYRKL